MRMKKYSLTFLTILLIFASLPGFAKAEDTGEVTKKAGKYTKKDEVIYGKLSASGALNEQYIVNSFTVTEPGTFLDFGEYTTIRNLTNLTDMTQDGKEVHFTAEDDFYYQGEVTNQPLPWDISMTYFLDNKEISPDDLAGESGKLAIQITTKANKTVDPVFFDYYLLQLTMTLDPLIFNTIQAPKATEAKEGKNTVLSFNIMPGQEEEVMITADVEHLEMAAIDITAIPANLAIEEPDTDDLSREMQKLTDAISTIHDAVGSFQEGTVQLSKGAKILHDGSGSFYNGLKEVNQSSGMLVDGSKEILHVFREIEEAIEDLPALPDLAELTSLPKELRKTAKELKEVADSLSQVNDAINQLPDSPINKQDIEALYDALEDADDHLYDVVKELEETHTVAQEIKALAQDKPAALAMTLQEIAGTFDTVAEELEDALTHLDAFDEVTDFTDGLNELTRAYETFHNGLIDYTDGLEELTTAYGDIHAGTGDLANGSIDLRNGAHALHEGTSELKAETSSLPEQMTSEIERFMEDFDYDDFEASSFISAENDKIGVVQFVLQTAEIKIEETEEIVEEEAAETSFWRRFLNLFQ